MVGCVGGVYGVFDGGFGEAVVAASEVAGAGRSVPSVRSCGGACGDARRSVWMRTHLGHGITLGVSVDVRDDRFAVVSGVPHGKVIY